MNSTVSKPSLRDRIDERIFDAIYRRSLVYTACWEDPAVDRQILRLGPDDRVLVITSAGCNALDYALQRPHSIHCIDANPRQNALLELKIAGIRSLGFDDFFAIFGNGHHPRFAELYRLHLREQLSPFAQTWWDEHANWFCSQRGSFYFHGLSGVVARGVRAWLRTRPQLREALVDLLDAKDLAEQQGIYDQRVAPLLWSRTVNWMISRQLVMNLLGVPHPQRKLVESQHVDGVAGFIRESVQYVFRQLPISQNYFWRVYLTGRYERDCCPEYLKREGFDQLKAGAVDAIAIHTDTVTGFLNTSAERISRYVLLDHMDWMSTYQPQALAEEWDAILASATPNARILLRSAHAQPAWLDTVRVGSAARRLDDVLDFRDQATAQWQAQDRVHTYAGLVVADVAA